MRLKIIIATTALLVSSNANAQAVFSEASIGLFLPNNVETIDYTFDDGFTSFTGSASIDYKSGVGVGYELGLRGVGSKHISVSGSYDYLRSDVASASLMGVLDGDPVSETVTEADFESVGIDADTDIHLALGNIRYDFHGPKEQIQPFFGGGVGTAFIQDAGNALAMQGSAGVKVLMTDRWYAGLKYRYLRMFDVTDDLGIEYRDVGGHSVSFFLGATLR